MVSVTRTTAYPLGKSYIKGITQLLCKSVSKMGHNRLPNIYSENGKTMFHNYFAPSMESILASWQ